MLAVVLSLLPFAMIELGLRFAPETSREAVDDDPLVNLTAAKPLFVLDQTEPNSARWIIPQERMNFFRPASFLATKPKNAKRIFVLGGSTVQGSPYETETAFSTWLQPRLQATDPGTFIEVVNCGGVSYASYRVNKILSEVLTHQPDAIVIYSGHNEFLESRSYANVLAMPKQQQWASRIASNFRTVREVRRWWASDDALGKVDFRTQLPSEVDARLDHSGGLEQYHRDATWRHEVEQHFADTLRRMVVACQRADVPIILCSPASELVSTSPFKIENSPILDSEAQAKFDAAWAKATQTDSNLSKAERIAACNDCLKLDPEHAGANYLLGLWAYKEGKSDSAREYLIRARDNDVCPIRATSPIVDAVHQTVREFELPFVDVIKLLDQYNARDLPIPDGISDPQRFVDHVHPTIGGHQMIADAVAVELERIGWPVADEAALARYRDASETHLASLSEVYFGRGKQRLAGLLKWAAGRAAEVGATETAQTIDDSASGSSTTHQP
jgi:lysophospholipase L1-like esterase